MLTLCMTALAAYLLGSIPFGYILVRVFRGQDIRNSGSGNIGATNVARSSPGLGALTLLLDALKGVAAVAFGFWIARQAGGSILLLSSPPDPVNPAASTQLLPALAAWFSIVGHSFPIWLRFRGGKGVATAVGAFAMLAPRAMLAAIVVFVVVLLLFRRVSLASIASAAAFPFLAWWMYRGTFQALTLGLIAASSLLIIARHHQNLSRLLSGTEPRFALRRG